MKGSVRKRAVFIICSVMAVLSLNALEIHAGESQVKQELAVVQETAAVKNPVVKLSGTDYTYNGKVRTPKVTVADSSGKRFSSKDYKVIYSKGRKNVGKYKVKVVFRGKYKGTFTKVFQIRPRKTGLQKAYLNEKNLVVSWDKQSSQTDGYQIQYTSDRKFRRNTKSSYVKNNSEVFKVLRKQKGNKYYVRIRTYKKVKFDGKSRNLYSDWSKVKGAGKKKVVALTYDDGPGKKTGKLLKQLEKYDAHATFFVVGHKVSDYKSVIKKMKNIGCEVGNHSYSHPNLGSASMSKVRKEIQKTNSKIKAVTKKKAALMRPPYGSIGTSLRKGAKMPLILWSVDTRDWSTRSASKTIKAATGNIKDGDIILMHDIHNSTIDASMTIIPRLKKKGYEMVTVSEMAAIKGKKLKNGSRYSRL